MTARERRVIRAFEVCVERGEYTAEYAILLIEDRQRYGWLSDGAKDAFYEWLDAREAEAGGEDENGESGEEGT